MFSCHPTPYKQNRKKIIQNLKKHAPHPTPCHQNHAPYCQETTDTRQITIHNCKVRTTTMRHVHDSAHFCVPVSGTTLAPCITWHRSGCTGHLPRDTYTIRRIFVYLCLGQHWHHALQGTVAGAPDTYQETRTRFTAFMCTCVQSGQQSSARTALWPSRPQRLICSTRRPYIPSAVPANCDMLNIHYLHYSQP